MSSNQHKADNDIKTDNNNDNNHNDLTIVPIDGSWICKLCTMKNNKYIPYCEVCLVPRDVQNNKSVLNQLKTKLVCNDNKLLNAQQIRDIAKLLRDLKNDIQQLKECDKNKNIITKTQKQIKHFCNKVNIDYNPNIVQDFITSYNIDNNNFNDQKKINKKCHPICRCGTKMISIKENKCYTGTTYLYVICDICDKRIKSKDTVYHCPKKKNKIHPHGFDICEKCTKQYVHRLRYFVALIICPPLTTGNYNNNDADTLRKMFKKLGFHKIICLEGDKATKANIDRVLNYVLPDKKKKNVNQFTVICYSGHGAMINGVYHFDLRDNETVSSEIINNRYQPTATRSFINGISNIYNELWNNAYRHNTLLLINSCDSGGCCDPINTQRIIDSFRKERSLIAAILASIGLREVALIGAISALAQAIDDATVQFFCNVLHMNPACAKCVKCCVLTVAAINIKLVIALAIVAGVSALSVFIYYMSIRKSEKCESISIIASSGKGQDTIAYDPTSPFIKHIVDFFDIFLNPDQSSAQLNGTTMRDTPPMLFKYLEDCYKLKNKRLGTALQDLQTVCYSHRGFEEFAMCPIFNQK